MHGNYYKIAFLVFISRLNTFIIYLGNSSMYLVLIIVYLNVVVPENQNKDYLVITKFYKTICVS